MGVISDMHGFQEFTFIRKCWGKQTNTSFTRDVYLERVLFEMESQVPLIDPGTILVSMLVVSSLVILYCL